MVVLAGLLVAGKLSGVTDGWTIPAIREQVDRAGPLGFVLYVVAFAIGELVHVPGMVFVGAGIMAYGKAVGFAVALVGSLVSITVSFFFVRAIGGKILAEVERPFVKKMMARLESRPILTVAMLRAVLWLAPALNYALALS